MGCLILFHPDALRAQTPIRDHLEHWSLIAPPAASSPTPPPSPILPHHHLLLLSAVSVKCHLPLLISKHHILLLLLRPQQLLLPSNHPCLPAPLPLSPPLLFLCFSENTTFCFSCCIECAAIKIFMNCRFCCCLGLTLRCLFTHARCFCNTPNYCPCLLRPNTTTLPLQPQHHLQL